MCKLALKVFFVSSGSSGGSSKFGHHTRDALDGIYRREDVLMKVFCAGEKVMVNEERVSCPCREKGKMNKIGVEGNVVIRGHGSFESSSGWVHVRSAFKADALTFDSGLLSQ